MPKAKGIKIKSIRCAICKSNFYSLRDKDIICTICRKQGHKPKKEIIEEDIEIEIEEEDVND